MKTLERIGLIINPIAGMGGKVALKGTDGVMLNEALCRGAVPEAGDKAARALRRLQPFGETIRILTAAGAMGEDVCKAIALPHEVIYTPAQPVTTARDTMAAAAILAERQVDLLVFAGGDGTARNICESIGTRIPALGIPAGVKIQSAVFAYTPEAAGALLAAMARGTRVSYVLREVVDLDEEAYRKGAVSASLYGMLQVPDSPQTLQSMKEGGGAPESAQLEGAAHYYLEGMMPGISYAVGAGTSAKCVLRALDLDYELLGVDIVRDGVLLKKDATEQDLWEIAKNGEMRIVVSPIGGQGFIFGRGNPQFSARVLRAVGKEGITVVATENKLLSIHGRKLHIDCTDEEVLASLQGYYNVLCGYGYFHPLQCI